VTPPPPPRLPRLSIDDYPRGGYLGYPRGGSSLGRLGCCLLLEDDKVMVFVVD